MASTESDRSASAPPQPHAAQQSSLNYHSSSSSSPNSSNPNPFLSSTRPRLDHPPSQPLAPSTSIADRVRSMSTSSVSSPPLAEHKSDYQGLGSGSIGEQLQKAATTTTATTNKPAVEGGIHRGKDMFAWFQDTVVISMIVRNWPG